MNQSNDSSTKFDNTDKLFDYFASDYYSYVWFRDFLKLLDINLSFVFYGEYVIWHFYLNPNTYQKYKIKLYRLKM